MNKINNTTQITVRETKIDNANTHVQSLIFFNTRPLTFLAWYTHFCKKWLLKWNYLNQDQGGTPGGSRIKVFSTDFDVVYFTKTHLDNTYLTQIYVSGFEEALEHTKVGWNI